MRSQYFWTFSCRFSICLAALLGIFQITSLAQTETRANTKDTPQISILWKQKSESDVQLRQRRFIIPRKFKVFGLDRNNMKAILDRSPKEFSKEAARGNPVIVEIPTPNGEFMRFRVEETPLLSPEVAMQFPEWKTYQGFGVDDPTATARFDVTMSGFHGYVLSDKGTFAIDPYQENDFGNYIAYFKKDVEATREMSCDIDSSNYNSAVSEDSNSAAPSFSNGTQIRTYRLAIAATGEYTNFFRQANDTDAQAQSRALAAIVVTINRVAGLYRRELAIDFTLVSGVNLIYSNSTDDPYLNTSGDLNANQTNIDLVIGAGNYDIGHLVGTGGGGIAQVGSVCGTGKARGLTGGPSPVGDPFDIDYVAHEIGHQFGQNHTFNATGNCGSSPGAARVEPGSGVTIMGYAGICSSISNVARNSIDVFHIYSIGETVNFTTSGTGAGATCGTVSGTNSVPVIEALSNFSIPFNTPFKLTANATDADSDTLTYNWEQSNAGSSVSSYPSSTDDDDITLQARPLFRSYLPSANQSRTFPSLPYILNNVNEAPVTYTGTSPMGATCVGTCITGEDLPSIARAMTFRVSVRDGKGGISESPVTVTSVNTSTPFKVTTANSTANFVGGANRNITWDVSGTTAAPINTANVRITLSTDGGQTFPFVLAASTANDGSELVAIPNTLTTQGRIKIEAIGNIFFDINDVNFRIGVAGSPAEVASGNVSIASESCGIPNSQPDPGETLTVSLPLSNLGGSNTNNLNVVLQATGGVANSISQSYGVLAIDGIEITRNFTFTVNPNLPCGSPVTLTFVVTDGATSFPIITKTFQTGAPSVSLSQNFDSVTAPALPSGWTNVQTVNTGINWVTTTTTPDSPPNAAFANETASVNASALVSPAVTINTASAQIKFRNKFELEDSPTASGVGYDGMVLEFSTNDGATWTDIIVGGGSFVSGGYTDTLSTSFQNPIGGRSAWSGDSNGYIDTIVNLPASLNGQSVKFRWLLGTDSSDADTGVWIDNVQVLGGISCNSCGVTTACRIQRRNDFNGDGTSDFSVFRPSTGIWYVTSGVDPATTGYQFGASTDKLVPADYDGDGKTDYAVFRNGIWYWTQSSDNAVKGFNWGAATDIPVAGDYTGDGKADLAVYRPSNGVWYVLNSSTGALIATQWGGTPTDIPVVGDFDGDCKMDYAVRRTINDPVPNATQYFIQKSSGGVAGIRFGRDDMAMAIGDYNGDGKSDIGVVENRGGLFYWYAINTENNLVVGGIQFGQTGDLITTGDYNGDGSADLSVWRPSNGVFYHRTVGNAALTGRAFGATTDTPTARWYQFQLP